MRNVNDFLVGTSNFSLFRNGVLVCTGTSNLNTSIEVSMQEQNVNAGKGNKLIYSVKYGREVSVTLEAADWKLEYIAVNVGSTITEGLRDVYKMGECVTLTSGVGILAATPIGNVAIEIPNGGIVTVKPTDKTIDLTPYGLKNESVKATYQFAKVAKAISIDADTAPNVFELVLDIEKHNNKIGKVGTVQVVIPSYQPSGNFTINLTSDGVSSENIDGKALAVEGDTCKDGSSVYAYIYDFDDEEKALTFSELIVTPGTISLNSSELSKTETLSVIGGKGELYAPIELDNADCTFVSDKPDVATVDENGVVTPVAAGIAKITVTYDGKTDEVDVNVA